MKRIVLIGGPGDGFEFDFEWISGWINVPLAGRYKRRELDEPRPDGKQEYEYDPPEPTAP